MERDPPNPRADAGVDVSSVWCWQADPARVMKIAVSAREGALRRRIARESCKSTTGSSSRRSVRTPELGPCQWFHFEDHRLDDAVRRMRELGVTYLRRAGTAICLDTM